MALQRVRGLGRSSSLARRGDAARRRGGARPRRGGRAGWAVGEAAWGLPRMGPRRGAASDGRATAAGLQLRCGLQPVRLAGDWSLQLLPNIFVVTSAMLVGSSARLARREASGRLREGYTTMPGASPSHAPVLNTLAFEFLPLSNDGLIRGLWGLRLINKTLYTLPQPQRPSRRVYSSGQDETVRKRQGRL